MEPQYHWSVKWHNKIIEADYNKEKIIEIEKEFKNLKNNIWFYSMTRHVFGETQKKTAELINDFFDTTDVLKRNSFEFLPFTWLREFCGLRI